MCLNPLHIRNPTSNIYYRGGQQLYIDVNCNKCSECVQNSRNEWYFRGFQQVTETLSKGGYILFDTLTYSDEHLPHLSDFVDISSYDISDFSCFNHKHFKLFLKNLRRHLEYHHLNSDFKYFLTSEYGVDERYTHRPHYHILFYISSGVNPLTFSRLISKCWRYGRTDGIKYNSLKYVAQHIYGNDVGFGPNRSFDVLTSVCMYVSKYVTKSSKFQSEVDNRIDALRSYIKDDDKLKELKRNIGMFHRQSQNFGAFYLQNMDSDQEKLLYENKCSMKDKDKVVKTYPLPLYYKRKLFYVNKKRDDNRRYWELTDFGKQWYFKSRLNSVSDKCVDITDLVLNYGDKNFFDYLLDGRNISEYVIYLYFYKGRLRSHTSINMQYHYQYGKLGDDEYNLYDWLQRVSNSMLSNSMDSKELVIIRDDKIFIPKLTPDKDLFHWVSYRNHYDLDFYEFYKLYSFSQNSCPEFRNFDIIYDYLEYLRKKSKGDSQITFDYLEDYKEKMKAMFNLIT